jgi:hypothetical protein
VIRHLGLIFGSHQTVLRGIVSSAMRVHLPNRAYLNDFERFMRGFEDDGRDDLTLVVPNGLFSVHPLATTMIASLALAIRARGGTVVAEGLHANSSTRYLERMGLFRLMGMKVESPSPSMKPLAGLFRCGRFGRTAS